MNRGRRKALRFEDCITVGIGSTDSIPSVNFLLIIQAVLSPLM